MHRQGYPFVVDNATTLLMGSESPTRPPVALPGPTGRRPWSTILLREWAQVKYPGVRLAEQFRLGPTSAKLIGVEVSPALERALRVENWYADGILALANEVLIIEAKVKATPAAVGQVKFYQRLAFSTPELQPLMALPFVPVVLFAEDDTTVSNFCRQEGVRVELYTPPWIADYLTQVQFRNRSTVQPIPAAAPGES
jgi:hypothetical protein